MFSSLAGPAFQDNPSKGCFPPAVIPVVEACDKGTEIAGFGSKSQLRLQARTLGLQQLKPCVYKGRAVFSVFLQNRHMEPPLP